MKKIFLSLFVAASIWGLFACLPTGQAGAKAVPQPSKTAADTYVAVPTEQQPIQDPLEESMERGAEIYTDYCIQCHLGQGEGVANTFPPLAKSNWLTPAMRLDAIKVVKYGQSGEIKVNGETYNSVMANLELYNDEVADVMNYIMNNWGNSQEEMVTEEEVKEVRK